MSFASSGERRTVWHGILHETPRARLTRTALGRCTRGAANSAFARSSPGGCAASGASPGALAAQSSGGRRLQRVIVKTHVARHKPGKAKGSLTRHASYLGRDSASADGKPGVFYDATEQGLDAKQQTAPWVPDRHHFRIIISPERGGDIPDMTAYVRDVMQRVEKDLGVAGVIEPGTKLQWIAINHHNTDNPHAHVVLRGKLEDGRDLVIPRAYLAHGMRNAGVGSGHRIAGRADGRTGPGSAAQGGGSRAVHVAGPDDRAALEPHGDRNGETRRIDLSPAKPIGFGADDRQLALARLQFLEGIGLAQKDKGTYWSVDETFGQSLRELGARTTSSSSSTASLATKPGGVQRMTGGAEVSAPVAGDRHRQRTVPMNWKMIASSWSAIGSGQAHYGRVRDTQAYRDLHVGSVAELGAGRNGGRKWPRRSVPLRRPAACIRRRPTRRICVNPNQTQPNGRSLRRFGPRNPGWRSSPDLTGRVFGRWKSGEYSIDADQYTRFSQRGGSRTDVRVIAEHTLDRQIEAHAVTWLDRQAFSDRPDARTTEHPAVQEAIEKRQEWLVRNGYAQRLGGHGAVDLNPDALRELAAEERADVAGRLAGKFGLPVAELPKGGTVVRRIRRH